MANAVTTQLLQDGARNAVVKIVGLLDTSDLASTAAVALADIDAAFVPTAFRIKGIQYSISSQLTVQLLWDATTDVVAIALAGQDSLCFDHYGGLQNNAGTGITGTLNILTKGWASGAQTFTLILELEKQGV